MDDKTKKEIEKRENAYKKAIKNLKKQLNKARVELPIQQPPQYIPTNFMSFSEQGISIASSEPLEVIGGWLEYFLNWESKQRKRRNRKIKYIN